MAHIVGNRTAVPAPGTDGIEEEPAGHAVIDDPVVGIMRRDARERGLALSVPSPPIQANTASSS